jgi:predicted DNA repair protein MutK
MASGLLALLDDMALLMDDIAMMSKMATKKTAGIVGDDLAVSATQLTGSAASRELPIVWAVTKGALVNKVIIVPLALLINWLLPMLLPYFLLLGGLYLCFEGAEKVIDWCHNEKRGITESLSAMQMTPEALMALEKEKIKGAIRTDFVLSIEIVLIALSALSQASFLTQAIALSVTALGITLLVYGVVACLVRMDDVGLYLERQKVNWKKNIGEAILWVAPNMLRVIGVVGTLAMLLVGGELLAHVAHDAWHFPVESWQKRYFGWLANFQFQILTGLMFGLFLVGWHHVWHSLVRRHTKKEKVGTE